MSLKSGARLLAAALLLSTAWTHSASAQTLEVAHNFPYGGHPYSTLIQASDGLFYGTTSMGGGADQGTVFRIDAAGNLQTLHEFYRVDGEAPSGALLEASDGFFYGTTSYGYPPYGGTVF
ncbi:MAG TPA: choice-of-anchor tandem repeat GloVer-containing protein, partial [Thermoanaerobaculia bacterium]|nr:choice-of-anchor tandem repeat GloVer-containing protein [Thermoanaerobaculia bacterium]